MSLITMRAAILDEPGKPMTIRDVQIREPRHGEVLIRTASVGICGTDLHFARGLFPYPMPTILGHEAAGTVERTGPGVTAVQPGDRVLVCDQMPCGQCGPCLTGKMVYCSDTSARQRQHDRLYLDGAPIRQYIGVSALAELMLVDQSGVIPMTGGISFNARPPGSPAPAPSSRPTPKNTAARRPHPSARPAPSIPPTATSPNPSAKPPADAAPTSPSKPSATPPWRPPPSRPSRRPARPSSLA